jgi:hypothetical protein
LSELASQLIAAAQTLGIKLTGPGLLAGLTRYVLQSSRGDAPRSDDWASWSPRPFRILNGW